LDDLGLVMGVFFVFYSFLDYFLEDLFLFLDLVLVLIVD
jgi:hypothetical protein